MIDNMEAEFRLARLIPPFDLRTSLVWVLFAVLCFSSCGTDDVEAGRETSASTEQAATTSTSVNSSSSSDGPTVTSTTAAGSASTLTVNVFYGSEDGDCGDVDPYERELADDVLFDESEVFRQTFQELVAGPSSEEVAAGAASFFSSDTADVIKSTVLSDGRLTIDFVDLRPLIPNASASCGSQALLAELNNTAFQFDEVERTRYLLEGSCTDFANWLQRECFDSERSGETRDVTTNELASGAGCTPATTETLPPGRWFGYVTEADSEQLTFDLACWFEGAAAASAAAEDGEESPPPNGYYIRNHDNDLRAHFVDSSVEVFWLPDPGDPATMTSTPYESWTTDRSARTGIVGVWITTTDDSHVVKIEEQYVP